MKNKNLQTLFFALSVGLVSSSAYSQVFFNNGADIMVSSGGLVQINGGFENAVIGNLTNDGEMHVDSAVSKGDFWNNVGTVDGSGDLYVEGDWINDGQFTADASNTSHVYLYGTSQLITGGNESHFWDLETAGSDVKTMKLNAFVQNDLTLNQNTELATDAYMMYVENTDPSAISNNGSKGSEGFVSSGIGYLSWAMNQSADYVFPVGSSLGTKRYRTVTLKPTTASSCRFFVSMENVNATTDGYDVNKFDSVTICKINDQFYHRIVRDNGSTSADIGISFDKLADGGWASSAQWQTKWEKTGTTTMTSATYETVTVAAYNNFTTNPFALAGIAPDAPVIDGANGLCAGDVDAGMYNATGDASSSFSWSVSGGSIVGASTGSTVNVDWSGTSTATVSVVQTDALGCSSVPATMSVNVFQKPIAGFVGDSAAFSYTLFSFEDTTIGNNGVANWQWDFGDGYTSSQENPYHQYSGPGTYSVQLIVTNENGCVDTILSDVTIHEGLLISNTFTPNGDGINDYFMVPSSGITEYHIMIYNRWGTLVFESDAPSVTWDGKTKAGLVLPSGTYFYTVAAKAGEMDHSSQGYVELLRGDNQ